MIPDHPCSPANLLHAEQQRLAREWELFATQASGYVCECGEYCNPTSDTWTFEDGHWHHQHGFPQGRVRACKMERRAA